MQNYGADPGSKGPGYGKGNRRYPKSYGTHVYYERRMRPGRYGIRVYGSVYGYPEVDSEVGKGTCVTMTRQIGRENKFER